MRFRLEARPLAVNACHCNACKKLTGADYIKTMVGERASFSTEGATLSWRRRGDSGREIDIVRCARCGARVWHEPLSAPDLVFIPVGLLETPNDYVPASHIWIERAAPNVAFEDDALLVRGQPTERAQLYTAFNRLYPK